MDINLKVMGKKDVLKVYNFFQDLKKEGAQISFTDIDSTFDIEKMLNDKNVFIYIAYYGDEIAGVFRGLRGNKYKSHSAFLTAAVDQRLRGQKIAQKLTGFGLEDMKNKGIKIVRAYVYSDNQPSVSTLLKQGFTLSGCVHMHHYNDNIKRYVDDLIFHKIL